MSQRFARNYIPVLLFLALLPCHGQDSDKQTPVPVISGSFGFDGKNTGGNPALEPFIEPVAIVPLGDKFLVETRGELVGFYTRQNGDSGPYDGTFTTALGYLQGDYIANSHVTITGGKFLIPFGIYSERQAPFWIKVFQDDPSIVGIGSPTGAGNGAMIRGVAASSSSYEWNYATYYTAQSKVDQFQSPGTIGLRTGVFFPKQRFETGFSYQRVLQGFAAQKDSNPFGFYFSWQPNNTSLDVKWEYAHSPSQQGHWLQAALQLDRVPVWRSFLKRAQIAGRVQQSFAFTDANEVDFAFNYYVVENGRVFVNYGRAFGITGSNDVNVWNGGFSYRFTFPAWPGGGRK